MAHGCRGGTRRGGAGRLDDVGAGAERAPEPEPALPPIPAELETRVWVLVRDRQHIQAVAMVRDELGLDLRRSKQVVDDIEQRLPGVVR